MRPGIVKYAENDTYAGGPDAGLANKVEPTATYQGDGDYPGYSPGPDLYNFLMHRLGKLTQERTRSILGSIQHRLSAAVQKYDVRGSASSRYLVGSPYRRDTVFFLVDGNTDPAASQAVYEAVTSGHGYFSLNAATSYTVAAAGDVISLLDADGDDHSGEQVVVLTDSGSQNIIGYKSNPSIAWAMVTGASVTPDWACVGCDQDWTNASGLGALWMIGGQKTGGGTYYLESSRTPSGGFTALGATPTFTAVPRCILHSQHYAGKMLPDDTGNPFWIVLSDVELGISYDGGVTWQTVTHGWAPSVSLTNKAVAYSANSRRLVAPVYNGASGDIYISDDNGVTWTKHAGVLPDVGGALSIVSDGFGGFLVWENNTTGYQYFVSGDDGLTWTACYLPMGDNSTTGWQSRMFHAALEPDAGIGDTPDYSQYVGCCKADIVGGSTAGVSIDFDSSDVF